MNISEIMGPLLHSFCPNHCISDSIILYKLTENKPANRFCELISALNINIEVEKSSEAYRLIYSAKDKKENELKRLALNQYMRLRKSGKA